MARVKHEYNVTTVYHFLCGKCGEWWYVTDWQIVKEASCPHCGTVANVTMSVSERGMVDRVC